LLANFFDYLDAWYVGMMLVRLLLFNQQELLSRFFVNTLTFCLWFLAAQLAEILLALSDLINRVQIVRDYFERLVVAFWHFFSTKLAQVVVFV
jgi:hypothetical protein